MSALTQALTLPACHRDRDAAPGESAQSTRASTAEPPAYVGTARCATCHQEEHSKWQGSDHDLAMQEATRATVLGDFDDAEQSYFGEAVRFVHHGEAFVVEALGADGERRRFPVVYAFGVDPLQQYLVEVEPGRLQAFPFAWDTRPSDQGGQRWFHLQPDEHIAPGDPLHWTGPSYNWNFACADCHSTAVHKSYDRAQRRYATELFEVNVGCEACHGPGSRHVSLAEADAGPLPEGSGFERRLASQARRDWSFVEGKNIAVLTDSQPTDELESCAPCHSRRSDLGGGGASYHDRYRLALLDELLYFDDGQIEDEVYVYGSFLQSKMYAAGVVCSDCHDAHGAGLRAEGNAVCTRCHRAEVFDGEQHHFHRAGAAGSHCTDCHMPKRTYMVIDDRGDHQFGLPRPALAASIGAPDPCTGCHLGKSARWAEREVAKRFERRSPHGFAKALHAARRGQAGGESALVDLVAAGTAPAIVRATALVELRNLRSAALPAMLMRASSDPSPLVRRAVAVAAGGLSPPERVEVARFLLRDPIRTVRIDAVGSLLGIDASSWSSSDRAALKRATAEYLQALAYNADRGEGLTGLAWAAALAGDFGQAESDLKEALAVDPTFTAAYVNLADLYRMQERDEQAESVLRQGLRRAADPASVELALGLVLVRLDRHAEALEHLKRAYRLRPEQARFGYVYAVALHDSGNRSAALRTLEEVHDRRPANRDVLQLLVVYNREMGRQAAAKRYSTFLEALGADRWGREGP